MPRGRAPHDLSAPPRQARRCRHPWERLLRCADSAPGRSSCPPPCCSACRARPSRPAPGQDRRDGGDHRGGGAAETARTAEATGRPTDALDYSTAEAGNPIVDGWYADPDVALYDDAYWVFPTTSRAYEEQTFMDAFSSKDLVHWTKHPRVLDVADVSWAKRALWAPAPIARNGKYYLYFAANDIQDDSELGGIGVAVADRPQGPYRDAIGEPWSPVRERAQPIDQDVFIDDDGQAYMYYGGWGHANVVKLNSDMTSLGTFADGTTYKEITPENYTEGSLMFKRNGTYYLMWSEGGWTGPDYSVSYAMADSPTGPFTKIGKVLEQDSAVARGSGHNSVANVPGTDIWYIFYHRRPLSETDGNHRALAYDRMRFNDDGTIQPVTMGVRTTSTTAPPSGGAPGATASGRRRRRLRRQRAVERRRVAGHRLLGPGLRGRRDPEGRPERGGPRLPRHAAGRGSRGLPRLPGRSTAGRRGAQRGGEERTRIAAAPWTWRSARATGCGSRPSAPP
ncbi:glycoside hydrolase family 43 protein [Streptomyces sp. M19]